MQLSCVNVPRQSVAKTLARDGVFSDSLDLLRAARMWFGVARCGGLFGGLGFLGPPCGTERRDQDENGLDEYVHQIARFWLS